MVQNPSWHANRFSATLEIPSNLWTPKVHCFIHSWIPTVPLLRQFDPVHTPTTKLQKTYLIVIILPSTLVSPTWSLSFRIPTKTCVRLSTYPNVLHAKYQYFRFYHTQNSEWELQIIKLLMMQFHTNPCPPSPHRFKYFAQHPNPLHTAYTHTSMPSIKFHTLINIW
jgi:hypothetical protein